MKVVELISNNHETAYREQVDVLSAWWKINILSPNIKTKKVVRLYNCTDCQSHHCRKGLPFLCRLKKVGFPPPGATTFYGSTIKSLMKHDVLERPSTSSKTPPTLVSLHPLTIQPDVQMYPLPGCNKASSPKL